LIYFYFEEWIAGAIPFGYSIFASISIVLFAITRQYYLFRFSQFVLMLLLPWLLMIALGGFINSSAVILWALLCPLGALLFEKPRTAPRWFAAYVVLIVISGFLQPYMRESNNLPADVVTFFFVMNISIVSTIVFVLLFYFVRERNTLQHQSDSLLLNILPKSIAETLKVSPHSIAEQHNNASILFADLVDFTPMSARLSPRELVDILNEVFTCIDNLAEEYGLEKIKTIGDCYMAASGVPEPRSDHAHILTRMALDMLDYMKIHEFGGQKLVFRIGINSGPLVAGVIGSSKFSYDLWGDTVNTASRMESHGVGGTVQIARSTYELIRDDFECEARGVIHVKGKGEMEVWHVTGEKVS
jgi:guanylate cyclase